MYGTLAVWMSMATPLSVATQQVCMVEESVQRTLAVLTSMATPLSVVTQQVGMVIDCIALTLFGKSYTIYGMVEDSVHRKIALYICGNTTFRQNTAADGGGMYIGHMQYCKH